MLFDERIASLVQRKYAFIEASHGDLLVEALRFVRWLFEEDLTRPYLMQILRSDDAERLAYAEHLKATAAAAGVLRDELLKLYPNLLEDGASVPEHERAHEISIAKFDRIVRNGKSLDQEEENLQREPHRDSSNAAMLIEILHERLSALPAEGERPELDALQERLDSIRERHAFRFRERSSLIQTSAASALRSVLHDVRALAPPPAGTADWMGFLPEVSDRTTYLAYQLSSGSRRTDHERASFTARFQRDLRRVYEEVLATLGTSLSSESIILRFKERCTWYDKARMRNIAGDDALGGQREDRLTLEMAKYVHDSGVFVLVRPRMSNLEPDIMTSPRAGRRFALESKVYGERDDPRRAVRKGFWQLHGYLTSLETAATRAEEGFLVIFRLGGPLCEAPATVATERFIVHILTFDLGLARDSGSAQPKTVSVTKDELIQVAAGDDPDLESASDPPVDRAEGQRA